MSEYVGLIYVFILTLLLPNNTIQVCFEKLASNGFETFVPKDQTKYIKRYKYCVEQIKVPEYEKIRFIFNKNQIKKDQKCLIDFFIFKETDNTKRTFRCKKGIPQQYLSLTNHITVSYKTALYTVKPIVYTLNYTIFKKEQSSTAIPITQVVTEKGTTVIMQPTKYTTVKTETKYNTEKTKTIYVSKKTETKYMTGKPPTKYITEQTPIKYITKKPPAKYITEQTPTKYRDQTTINQSKTLKATKTTNSFSVMTNYHSINEHNSYTPYEITEPDTNLTNGKLPQGNSTSQTLVTTLVTEVTNVTTPSLVHTIRQKSTTNIKKSMNKTVSFSQSEVVVSTSAKTISTNQVDTTGNENTENEDNEISVMESSKQSRMIASNMRLAIVFVMGATSFLFLVDLILYTRQRGFFFTMKEALCADTKDLERIQLLTY